jgi:hypothetical protein
MIEDIAKKIAELKNQMETIGKIPDQLKSLRGNFDGEAGGLFGEIITEFELSLKDAEQGKQRDMMHIIEKIQKAANGN